MLPPDTSGEIVRDALAVDVVERQRGEHAVGGRELVRGDDGAAGVDEVAVRQQRALRRTRRARRVHQHRGRRRFGRAAGFSAGGREQLEVVGRGRPHDRAAADPRDDRREPRDELRRGKHDPRCRMRERVLDQRVLREQADRRDNVTAVHGAEEGAGGGHAVRQHVRHDLAGPDAARGELRVERARRRAKSRVGQLDARLGGEQEWRVGLRGGVPIDDVPQRGHAEGPPRARASRGTPRRSRRRSARARAPAAACARRG